MKFCRICGCWYECDHVPNKSDQHEAARRTPRRPRSANWRESQKRREERKAEIKAILADVSL